MWRGKRLRARGLSWVFFWQHLDSTGMPSPFSSAFDPSMPLNARWGISLLSKAFLPDLFYRLKMNLTYLNLKTSKNILLYATYSEGWLRSVFSPLNSKPFPFINSVCSKCKASSWKLALFWKMYVYMFGYYVSGSFSCSKVDKNAQLTSIS